MAEAVKTALLKTLASLLAVALPGVSVGRDLLFPVNLMAKDAQGNLLAPLPALYFYQGPEKPEVVNRQAWNKLELDLAYFDVFANPVYNATPLNEQPAWQKFAEATDVVAAQVHALWYDRASILQLRQVGLIRIEEGEHNKAPGSQDYGELVLSVRLTYGYPLGQAFIN